MLTVVLTHYRMPERRLQEFLEWNGALFQAGGWSVIVVSDVPRPGLPPWARAAVYPRELPVFALTRTSNYGIRLAGGGIVCKTDPDCCFSAPVLELMAALPEGQGLAPAYCMAPSFALREQAWDYHLARRARTHRTHPMHEYFDGRDSVWEASSGTLCLHYGAWERMAGYDERMTGYGVEDGIARRQAWNVARVGVERPDVPFWHIAHSDHPQQAVGRARPDHWGRASGFNPQNHGQNKRVLRGSEPWHVVGRDTWGTAAP